MLLRRAEGGGAAIRSSRAAGQRRLLQPRGWRRAEKVYRSATGQESERGSSASELPDPAIPTSITAATAATGAAPASSPPRGWLGTPEFQVPAFTLLVAASATLMTLSVGAPELLLCMCFGIDPSYADVALLRIAGAGLWLSVVLEYVLKDASEHNRLSCATYQRLLLVGQLKSASFLAILALSPSAWTPAVLTFYPTVTVMGIAVYTLTLAASQNNRFALPDLALSPPTNRVSWTYALFTLMYIATAVFPFLPELLFTCDTIAPQAIFVKHLWAPSFLAAAGVCWVMKDAANKGCLGASTFKWLNLGLAGIEVGSISVLVAGMLSGHVPVFWLTCFGVGATACIVSFLLWQCFTVQK